MRKIVSVLLAIVIMLTGLAFARADIKVVEVQKNASIRTGAGYNEEKIRLAEAGEKYEYVDESNGWYQIIVDNQTTGFLPKDSCRLTTSSAPVAPVTTTKPAVSSGNTGSERAATPDSPAQVKVDKIKFTESTIKIAVGYSTTARYTLTPQNANETLTWKSSNEKIATVDENGCITGVKKGSCKVTVFVDNGKKQKGQVNVKVDEYDLVFTERKTKKGTYYYKSGRYTITGKGKTGCIEMEPLSIAMIAAISGGDGRASDTFDVTPVKPGEDTITVKAGKTKTVIKVLVLPEAFDPPKIQDLGYGMGAIAGTEGVFNGHTYRIISEKCTWEKALEKCEKEGGYLATITSAEEQKFLGYLNSTEKALWIGLHRKNDDLKQWYWITGEEYSYSHWRDGEPNNQYEKAGSMRGYGWNDLDESHSNEVDGYICEWDTIVIDVRE